MNIIERIIGSVLVLTVTGRIDSLTSKAFEDVIVPKVQECPALVIELAAVHYVSSAGLRVLLKAAKSAKSNHHRLVLAGLAPQVQEIFDISGISAIFEIKSDLERSLEAFA